MNYQNIIIGSFIDAVKSLYQFDIDESTVIINPTRPEFEGEYTIVLFPYIKQLKKSPEVLGNEIGNKIIADSKYFAAFNIVKGFLNLSMSNVFWTKAFNDISTAKNYGNLTKNGKKVMVEFSSPNTNKPLHLGHIRNILLGWSYSKIMEAAGYEVIKTQIINDRGIAVCKSMLAWNKYGKGATPDSSGIKGDHFVGEYYVLFEKKFQEEYKAWQASKKGIAILAQHQKEGEDAAAFYKRYKNDYFNEFSALGIEAKEMLLKWEDGDTETIALWKKMNAWVYDGFEITYKNLGVNFDKLYHESDTYLLGKDVVNKGIESKVFYKKEDGSVWIDLEDAGLDQKIVLRSDGTSVYITQDIGTAQMRYKDFGIDAMVYTVADEQDYHFKVLFEILKRLGEPYADDLHHLSYGMVDLPTGKMKSREGTVVDADDLMAEVINEATAGMEERSDQIELNPEEKAEIVNKIGLAALKYFIIKVNPKKRMTFDPKESVDMQGQTGPYIQNAYVRIRSILRRNDEDQQLDYGGYELNSHEKEITKQLLDYPLTIADAAKNLDPSSIANYAYALAKSFHKYYHDVRILKAETEDARKFRLVFCDNIAKVLKSSMDLLGIEMPEKM
jgi:arginyl-tRNA synthetase